MTALASIWLKTMPVTKNGRKWTIEYRLSSHYCTDWTLILRWKTAVSRFTAPQVQLPPSHDVVRVRLKPRQLYERLLRQSITGRCVWWCENKCVILGLLPTEKKLTIGLVGGGACGRPWRRPAIGCWRRQSRPITAMRRYGQVLPHAADQSAEAGM